MKHKESTHNTRIYVKTQFDKTTNNMLPSFLTLLKACPVKGYNTLLNVTMSKDFNTLLGVCLVRGLKNIQLGIPPC